MLVLHEAIWSRRNSKDKFAAEIVVGEMDSDPLHHLERVIQEIYLPQLLQQDNKGYGEVEYKEIVTRVNQFLAQVSITLGQTKGETCLPLPPLAAHEPDINNKDLIHNLEGAVITWSRQIKEVLDRSHEDSLKQGLHPTPDEELRFWESQAANLNAIFSQLKSKRMRQVMIFLDQAKSSYCGPFASLCKEVFGARLEANNNVKFLRTLEKWFQELNQTEFDDLGQLYKPMMHIILLIWKNSRHYNTPASLIVLVRKISNAIIKQARQYVSGKAVFGLISDWENIRDAQQAVDQLRVTLSVCAGSSRRPTFSTRASRMQNAQRIHGTCRTRPSSTGSTHSSTAAMMSSTLHSLSSSSRSLQR